MNRNVTVTESLFVAASPEVVWDYTQDYGHRTEWDDSILEAEVLQEPPELLVRIRAKGGLRFKNKYTLFRRPNRTSVTMVDVKPAWVSGGGGSWVYEEQNGGTLWTQTNTLSFSNPVIYRLLGGIMKWRLRSSTRKSMQEAKLVLEGERAPYRPLSETST